MTIDPTQPDWLERKTAELLARANRSPYFADIIADALDIERRDAYVWEVCLGKSVDYWCS